MPRQSRKLRLLILATLASTGASLSSAAQAGSTAWSCQADPKGNGWACAQTGAKAQAEQAVRMSQHAAGNPEPDAAQLELATSPQHTEPTAPAEPLAASMAEARAEQEHRAAEFTPQGAAKPAADDNAGDGGSMDTAMDNGGDENGPLTVTEPEPVPPSAASPAPAEVNPLLAGVGQGEIGFSSSPPAPAAPTPPPTPQPQPQPAAAVVRPEPPPKAVAAPATSAAEPVEPPTPEPPRTTIANPSEAPTTPSLETATPSAAAAPEIAATAAPDSAPAEAPPTKAPAAGRYDLARRAGGLGDDDIAALEGARKALEAGAAEDAPLNPEIARLRARQGGGDVTTTPTTDVESSASIGPEPQTPPALETYPSIDPSRAWSLCGANDASDMTRDIPRQPVANREQHPLNASADDMQGRRHRYYSLYGNAEISRGDQSLKGEMIYLDAVKQRADADGDVQYREAGVSMRSDWGYLQIDQDQGEFGRSDFYLPDRHARGTADHIDVKSKTVWNGQDTTYTTCNYGDDAWYLHSDSIELDRGEGVGTARNAWVEFKGVPIAYTPWISFPIDDRRKTGLLAPSFGNSDVNGTKLVLPFYLNIAPDRDMTVTPYLLSKRGLRLDTEFRYLNPSNEGLVEIDALPGDKVYGKDRGLFHWEHTASLADDLSLDIDASHVSDQYYLKDFEKTVFDADTTSLVRRALLTYAPGDWVMTARVQDDYLIDRNIAKASRAYRRLPELTATTRQYDPLTGLDFTFDSRYAYFQNDARLEGSRLELTPTLRLPFRQSYGHITPEVALHYIRWDMLSGPTAGVAAGDALVVPSLAVDSELYLDKEIELGGSKFIHTIEPRIRYTVTPEVDQSARPNFDSTLKELSYSNLFDDNRFDGGDRIGDANQIAVGVTSRLLDDNYAEYGHLSFGELYYLDQRKVTIGAQTDADRSATSDFVGQLYTNLPYDITAIANLRWDHRNRNTPSHNWQIYWSASPEQYLGYQYTQQQGVTRESVVNFGWPVSPQWHVIGRYEYDHLRGWDVSSLFGLEYESCCWAARMAVQTDHQTYTTSASSTATPASLQGDTAVMFQIELKGLSGFGNNLKSFFGSKAYY